MSITAFSRWVPLILLCAIFALPQIPTAHVGEWGILDQEVCTFHKRDEYAKASKPAKKFDPRLLWKKAFTHMLHRGRGLITWHCRIATNPACIGTGSNLIRVIPTAARAWAGCCVCGIVVFGGAGQRWHPHRRLADTHLFGFYRLAFAGFQGFLFYFLSRTAAALFVSPILSYNPAELLRVVLVYGGSFPGADSCIALVAIRQCQVI